MKKYWKSILVISIILIHTCIMIFFYVNSKKVYNAGLEAGKKEGMLSENNNQLNELLTRRIELTGADISADEIRKEILSGSEDLSGLEINPTQEELLNHYIFRIKEKNKVIGSARKLYIDEQVIINIDNKTHHYIGKKLEVLGFKVNYEIYDDNMQYYLSDNKRVLNLDKKKDIKILNNEPNITKIEIEW